MSVAEHEAVGPSREPSVQLLMVGFSVFGGALAGLAAGLDRGILDVAVLGPTALAVVAVVLALVGWRRARWAHSLTPLSFWDESGGPFEHVDAAGRRSLVKQMAGREAVTATSADTVRLLISRKRRRDSALSLSVLAMFVTVGSLGTAASPPGVTLVALAALIIVILIASRYERRRENRVLRRVNEAVSHRS
jgi:hypothetical protein